MCFINSFLCYILLCLLSFNIVAAQQRSAKSDNHLSLPFCLPLKPKDFIKVSSFYGYRLHPILKKILWHEGVDLVAQKGKPVYASAQGIVLKSLHEKGYGNNIIIAHKGGFTTLYGHLWLMLVGHKEKVFRGQLIGFVGDSGNVTGPHLHYEIWFNNKKVDPLLVLKNQFLISKVKLLTY